MKEKITQDVLLNWKREISQICRTGDLDFFLLLQNYLHVHDLSPFSIRYIVEVNSKSNLIPKFVQFLRKNVFMHTVLKKCQRLHNDPTKAAHIMTVMKKKN